MHKGKDTKQVIEWKRNIDIREDFIKTKGGKDREKGYKEFLRIGEKSENFKKLRDIPIPSKYAWIWKHFLNIWNNCEYDINGNPIFTYRTVNEYVECMKVPLTVYDKTMLFKIKNWALETYLEVRHTED